MGNLTRSFITDMTANFLTTGNPGPTGLINVEAVGPYNASLQIDQLDPGEYSVQFAMLGVTPTLAGVGQTPAPRAEIIWKVDGQQLRRVVSVVSGASISGVANAVHVKIQDQSGVFSSLTDGSTYKVVATLSKGTRPTIMQPAVLMSVTGQVIESGHVNPVRFQVPQDSGVVSIYTETVGTEAEATHPLPGDVQVFFISQGGIVLGGYYPLIETGWVPLPPGTFEVHVGTSMAAPNTQTILPIWGIEG